MPADLFSCPSLRWLLSNLMIYMLPFLISFYHSFQRDVLCFFARFSSSISIIIQMVVVFEVTKQAYVLLLVVLEGQNQHQEFAAS
jgi:hypothetical protein